LLGASGSVLGLELLRILVEKGVEVYITATKQGLKVCEYETSVKFKELVTGYGKKYFDIDDLFAPMCSGSFQLDATIVCPCSMDTLARIANGMSQDLIERSADVCIKEKKKLILVPRETPFNSIHLKNMLTLSECGTVLLPPTIAFYNKSQSMDYITRFFVARILDQLGIEHTLLNRWGI
jgi:4-hydroxy-3-polyprenylbenzoate decarboxylase